MTDIGCTIDMTGLVGLTVRSKRLVIFLVWLGSVMHLLHYTIVTGPTGQETLHQQTNRRPDGSTILHDLDIQDDSAFYHVKSARDLGSAIGTAIKDDIPKEGARQTDRASPWIIHSDTSKGYAGYLEDLAAHSHHQNNSRDVINTPDTSFCQGIRKPQNVEKKYETWQQIVPGRSYVFSAWFDGRVRRHGLVRLIGMVDVRSDGRPAFCQLWYHHLQHPILVTVRDDIVPETHNKR